MVGLALALAGVIGLAGEIAVDDLAAAGSASQGNPSLGVPAAEARPRPRPLAELTKDFDILASGDLLIHGPLYRLALAAGGDHYDFRSMLADVRRVIRGAALAICHIETPFGPGSPSGYPVFNTPADLAAAIRWAGWDVCDTASNHSVDRGQAGVDGTADALDAADVRHTGSFRSAAEARKVLMLDVLGVRIAFLAYTSSTNGIPSPHRWSVNLISRSKIAADARRARRLGADLVIVNFHWGTQYVHTPDADQVALAGDLLKHGVVDLILGQHPHVVQPIERIAGRFVVFSEGNFLSGQPNPDRRDGLIARIHVHAEGGRASITRVDYIPVWVRYPGYVVEPVGLTLRRLVRDGLGAGALAEELRASYRRTVAYVGTSRSVRPVPSVLES
jgi:poly-gamma-glutamate capsule biosynthesis protein CapA/YwtB (metallophosphatase superfamily)